MKKIFIGKAVFFVLVLVISFRGSMSHYMDLSLFVGPLIIGTVIRILYMILVRKDRYRRFASLSYLVFGVLWTILLGFTQTAGTAEREVMIWLPVVYGTMFSIGDDLLFWTSMIGGDKPSRRRYLVGVFSVCVIILLSFSGYNVVTYINGPALIYIVAIVIPMLLITDTFGDVVNGVRFVVNKDFELTTKELKSASIGLKLVLWGVAIGAFLSVLSILSAVQYNEDFGYLYIKIMMISPLYGIIISGFVAMVRAVIEKEVIYRESV